MSRPEMRADLKSRLVGLVFVLVGLGVGAWVVHDARSSHFFSLRPCLSAVMVAMGVWAILEAPELPAREFSPLGNLLAWVGMGVGLAFTWYVMGRVPFIS